MSNFYVIFFVAYNFCPHPSLLLLQVFLTTFLSNYKIKLSLIQEIPKLQFNSTKTLQMHVTISTFHQRISITFRNPSQFHWTLSNFFFLPSKQFSDVRAMRKFFGIFFQSCHLKKNRQIFFTSPLNDFEERIWAMKNLGFQFPHPCHLKNILQNF